MTISLCEQELGHFCDVINKEISCTPEIIYHYTSSNALLSIIQNKELWFSNIFFLNDSTENKYIYTCLKDYVNENTDKYNDSFCMFMTDFSDYFLESNVSKSHYVLPKTYVASFSIKEDELSLWNYYTKSNIYLGYNIGFNTKDFINYSNDGDLISYYGQVIYGKDLLNKIFDKIILDIYKIFVNLDLMHQSILFDDLAVAFNRYSMFFKDKSFSSESEYRIVWQTNNQAYLHERNGFFIPYQKYSIPIKSIRSIIISPTQNFNIAKLGIEELLYSCIDKKYTDTIKIKKSNIPLRY